MTVKVIEDSLQAHVADLYASECKLAAESNHIHYCSRLVIEFAGRCALRVHRWLEPIKDLAWRCVESFERQC